MSRFLLAWELGAGLGHLANLRVLTAALLARQHFVALCLRDLSRVELLFAGLDVQFFQAPVRVRVDRRIEEPLSYAHLLHNFGFADSHELIGMARAWRSLFDLVRPNVVVCDHSPTALVASAGLSVRRALYGAGFYVPPAGMPLPKLRPWVACDEDSLARDELQVLNTINDVLSLWTSSPLSQVADLYSQVQVNFLTTFQELDPFPNRSVANYIGLMPNPKGEPPRWPPGRRPRVFCYLKSFPALPYLLQLLRESGHSTLVVGDGLEDELRKAFQSTTMRFSDRPLGIEQVAVECDLAILNGGHGTTATFLAAGKPILQLPISLEQWFNASRTEALRAGLLASSADRADLRTKLETILADRQHFASGAEQFAAKYAQMDSSTGLDRIVTSLEALSTPE